MANNILLALPDSEFDSSRPQLEFVLLPQDRSLQEPNRKLEFAYFLNAGMISLVFTLGVEKALRWVW